MCRGVLVALVFSGCVGNIVQKEPSPPRVELPVSECKDIAAAPGTRELQRLTSRELDRTVAAVLGDSTHAYRARLAVSDELISTRRRYFRAQSGTPVWAGASVLAAEEVSVAVAPQFVACTGDERVCARQVIERTGRKLWRRTLSPGEVDLVLASYDAARVEGTHADGIQTVLMTLLAAPDFFFFQAAPLNERPTGNVLAERLASVLWQQAPDDALLDAAETGALDTTDGFDAQVERMLADPRADETFANFLSHWLAPEKVATIEDSLAQASRSTAQYPGFKPPGAGADGLAYSQALSAFLQSEARVSSGSFEGLMLSKKMAVNEAVARNLGLAAVSSGIELREVDTERRAGVLGQPAVLTAFGRFEASDPVHRGVFLLRYALCNDVPPPDANVNTALPPAENFPTTRARFVSATVNTQCAGCHSLINPLGFAWENFDAVGRFRSQEGTTAVDATATLPTNPRSDVDGLADLARVLASDPTVRSCLTRQFSAWALRRHVDDQQFCAVRPHADGFYEPSGPISSLVKAVLTSDAFRAPATPVEVAP